MPIPTLKEMFALTEEVEDIFDADAETNVDKKNLANLKRKVDVIRNQDEGLGPIDSDTVMMLGDVLSGEGKEPQAAAMALLATKLKPIYDGLYDVMERERAFHEEVGFEGLAQATNWTSILNRGMRSLIWFAGRTSSERFKLELKRFLGLKRFYDEAVNNNYVHFTSRGANQALTPHIGPDKKWSAGATGAHGNVRLGGPVFKPGELAAYDELCTEFGKMI